MEVGLPEIQSMLKVGAAGVEVEQDMQHSLGEVE
jgi:hypothetical protein